MGRKLQMEQEECNDNV